MNLNNINDLTVYIVQYGIYAPLIAFALFMIQAILPVFPYIILAAAGGILFGFKLGFLLAWLGALTGACLAYWMCKYLGYASFLHRLYNHFGYDVNQINSTLAFWTIVITRIIPVIPTPLINVAAALGGVSFRTFLASSAIGKLPSAVLYTGLGLALFNAQDIKTALLILGVFLLVLLSGWYQAKKHFSPRLPESKVVHPQS